jgi:hypothetical protein
MSATTPRTISNAPDLRQLLAAVGALILAVALLVVVAFSRQASFQASTSVAEPAVAFDHGWSTAGTQRVVSPTVNGSTGFVVGRQAATAASTSLSYPAIAAMRNAGIPVPNDATGFVGTQNGGILYTGIPYTAPVAGRELIVRTESGGLRYTGIPYPAPATEVQGGSNGTRFAQ